MYGKLFKTIEKTQQSLMDGFVYKYNILITKLIFMNFF